MKDVFNKNLGVLKENLWSPMNLFGSPMKIWGSATKIWGLIEKFGLFNELVVMADHNFYKKCICLPTMVKRVQITL